MDAVSPQPANDPDGVLPVDMTTVDLLRAVAVTGTLAGAARRIGMTASGAARLLERVGLRLGAPVTAGDRENLRPTSLGAALIAGGLRYSNRLRVAVRRTIGTSSVTAGTAIHTLRIATDHEAWAELVDDVARSLPGVLPTVVRAGPAESQTLFDNYQVDSTYAWHWETGGHMRRATTHHVVDEPLWVGLPTSHPCAGLPAVSLRDLRDDHWIADPDPAARSLILSACRGAGFEPRVVRVAESTAASRSLLWQSVGVALLSPMAVPRGKDARFVLRPIRNAPLRSLALVTDPMVVPQGGARRLRGCLSASYRARAQATNPDYAASIEPVQAEEPSRSDRSLEEPEEYTHDGAGPGPDIDPEDVAMLRVVARSGSLNRAAPVLLISQPALSRRVVRLERRLGVKLLMRNHQGAALTGVARSLVELATAAELEFAAVVRAANARRTAAPSG